MLEYFETQSGRHFFNYFPRRNPCAEPHAQAALHTTHTHQERAFAKSKKRPWRCAHQQRADALWCIVLLTSHK